MQVKALSPVQNAKITFQDLQSITDRKEDRLAHGAIEELGNGIVVNCDARPLNYNTFVTRASGGISQITPITLFVRLNDEFTGDHSELQYVPMAEVAIFTFRHAIPNYKRNPYGFKATFDRSTNLPDPASLQDGSQDRSTNEPLREHYRGCLRVLSQLKDIY